MMFSGAEVVIEVLERWKENNQNSYMCVMKM